MYELIEHKTLDAAAASITFSNIPSTYTSLLLVTSLRSSRVGAQDAVRYAFNGSTSGHTYYQMYGGAGSGSIVTGSATNAFGFMGIFPAANNTAGTFGSQQLFISNYTSSSTKSVSISSVSENNASTNYQLDLISARWESADPVTSITLTSENSANFVQNSSATLYGVGRNTPRGNPKGVGGTISYANGHWFHTFTGSGTFVANDSLQVDALVVAGGGGGGSAERGGGGGAGGLLMLSQTALTAGSYPVIIGAGGAGYASTTVGRSGNDGSSSSFLSTAPLGGGGGGAGPGSGGTSSLGGVGRAGGSGGGGGVNAQSGQYALAGGSGTAGQGNNGGSSGHDHTTYGKGGGGGGAGGVGASISANGQTGSGGIGLPWHGTYYAGGGGGAGDGSNGTGPGGLGGGGNAGLSGAPAGQAGTANTGGGGGAGWFNPNASSGSGGSGIVIVRYRAD